MQEREVQGGTITSYKAVCPHGFGTASISTHLCSKHLPKTFTIGLSLWVLGDHIIEGIKKPIHLSFTEKVGG